jgi:hypothetical protein
VDYEDPAAASGADPGRNRFHSADRIGRRVRQSSLPNLHRIDEPAGFRPLSGVVLFIIHNVSGLRNQAVLKSKMPALPTRLL